MDTIKCLRCNSKDAVYSCMQCDSFKFLCTRCDSYVHSLPSKNKHRRNSLCNIEEQKDTQHMNTTFNPPQMTLPNNNTNLFSKNFEQNEFKEILNQEYREEENTSKGVENVHHSQLGACSMDYKSNTSYSREYLNEFKVNCLSFIKP